MSHTTPGGPCRPPVVLALILLLLPAGPAAAQAPDPAAGRDAIGVAFGGGSARGIAHVGVIRWFEEHRVPIDVAAGTSMGGLIGGAFASGMDAEELEAMLAAIDWDAMFGSSNFAFKNVRRKRDSRAYPSHLEFGLKGGMTAPTSLNSGQQVDLLLARIAAPYYGLASFDELPTPFRTVAVDLRKARYVVLDRGSLAVAMRATMSLPLIFPPVEIERQVLDPKTGTVGTERLVLIDGGAMDNVPADVVRDVLKADRVIAVNVGDLGDKETIDFSMFGLAGESLDAMMRASSLRAIDAADLVIDVPLKAYGSLDWRKYRELIAAGYQAAEAMKDDLLPLAVDETAWRAWLDARAARRRSDLPVPASVLVEGAAGTDTRVMQHTLARHVGRALDIAGVEEDLTALGGLDRYQALDWALSPAGDVLEVRAAEKKYGPPFMLLGFSLENTTANEFRFGLAGRYLGYDLVGSGSELRVDAGVGSDPAAVIELYRPLRSTPLFVAPNAGVARQTLNRIDDGRIVAAYRQTRSFAGLDAGVNVSRIDEIRLGVQVARLSATVKIGDPGLPELQGRESLATLRWTHDGQDSPVVPSHGLYLKTAVRYYLDAPVPAESIVTTRSSKYVTQADVSFNQLWSVRDRGRLFVSGSAGTSFDGDPLPTEQFALGGPFRLGAFDVGERRGDHLLVLSAGYLHQATRLPDFLGGPLYVGGWLDAGDAYDAWKDADVVVNATAGAIVDTLLGPAFVAVSAGGHGRWRAYIGIGRVF